MNNNRSNDLQHFAAGHLCYKLLRVQHVKDMLQTDTPDRHFIEAKSHLLLLSTAAKGRLVIDGRFHSLRPGSVFVAAPGQLIEITNYSSDAVGLIFLYFQIHVLSPATESIEKTGTNLFPFTGEAHISPASLVLDLYHKLISHWGDGTPSALLRCEAILLELLSLVLGYEEQQIALALESARLELERNYKTEITIDHLAGIARLSRYHFMRLFKERYHKGVMEYRTDLRLMEAKHLMQTFPTDSISRIAHQIGYKNETYFSSIFKKQTGIAPAVYQRNQLTKVAAYSWVNFGQLLALQTIPFAAPIDHYWTDHFRNKFSFEVKVPLSHQYDFNYEALAKAQPEYIIAMDGFIPKEEQARLSLIAPVLFIPKDLHWREHLELVAEFLGRPEDARKWLLRYDRKAAAIREQLPPSVQGNSLLVLLISNGQLQAWGATSGTVLYEDLKFAIPRGVADFHWKNPVETHQLSEFGADRIIIHKDESAASETLWHTLSTNTNWQSLSAVQKQQVHLVTGYPQLDVPWNEFAAYNCDRFLDEVPKLLQASHTPHSG